MRSESLRLRSARSAARSLYGAPPGSPRGEVLRAAAPCRFELRRGGGIFPDPVHRAQATLAKAARTPGFAALADAHEALHHAIVHAAASPRIEAAHAALAGELRLFLTRLRPAYDGPTLAAEHAALLDDLENGTGPEAVQGRFEASTQMLLAAMG